MKNVQISDNDLMGNRFNGHDLHFYLRDKDIESNQLVWEKRSNDPHTYELARWFKNKRQLNEQIHLLQTQLSAQNSLYPFSYTLLFDKIFLESDIVHYHLIHNHFFNITHLSLLTKLKPTVWTLHDPWAVTGHCIHFFDCQKWKHGCGDCRNLKTEFALEKDTTAINWEIKKNTYQTSDLDLIVSSKWMYDIVKESPLTKHFETHIIPFGIDRHVFNPIPKKQAKDFFKIPQENKVIAFRASAWKLKGLHHIKEALAKLDKKDNITLLTSNQVGLIGDLAKSFHVVELDWINDVETLRNFYSAAEVFLMPSKAESFGMSAIESMACGTPVIAFADTVLADTICAPIGGIAVENESSDALMAAIQLLLMDENKQHHLADKALQIVKNKYDLDQYINSITGLYQHVIDKRRQDERAIYLVNQLKNISFTEIDSHSYDDKSETIQQDIAEILGVTLKIKVSKKLKKYPKLHSFIRKIYFKLWGSK